MSIKALEKVLRAARNGDVVRILDARDAIKELEALKKAACDLTRLHVGDGVYRVRDSAKVMSETPKDGNTWEHPDVKAWSDAAQVLAEIAKERK